jgi:gliding motility-associated-like protein
MMGNQLLYKYLIVRLRQINHLTILFFVGIMILFFSEKTVAQKSLQIPEVDSISVLPDTLKPIISWFPNTDNTKTYVIYFLTLNEQGVLTWQETGRVDGIDSTRFIHYFHVNSVGDTVIVDPCNDFCSYRIRAFDPDGTPPNNTSDWSDTLRTIYLDQPVHNICANTIRLNWTGYMNMREELAGYQVLASKDGINFSEIGFTEPDITEFVHTDPTPNEQYTYKIRAVNEDGTRTSTSCPVTVFSRTYPRPEPDSTAIISVSVEDNSFVRINWDADFSAPILQFDLERRGFNENGFTIFQSLEDNVSYYPASVAEDNTADFAAGSYTYRLVMWDSCGQNPYMTDTSRTIHLSGRPTPAYINQLQWNKYYGWNDSVYQYKIYRKTETLFELIGQIAGSDNEYNDDVSAFRETGGVVTYYVEAVEEGGNNAVSKSNHIELEMETRVIVPNAFIFDGVPPDDTFKPTEIYFIAENSYEMLIFNRWGQMVFKTTDTHEGWDGRYNGELQPAGAYVYLIKFLTPEGRNVEQRGTVTLIR